MIDTKQTHTVRGANSLNQTQNNAKKDTEISKHMLSQRHGERKTKNTQKTQSQNHKHKELDTQKTQRQIQKHANRHSVTRARWDRDKTNTHKNTK